MGVGVGVGRGGVVVFAYSIATIIFSPIYGGCSFINSPQTPKKQINHGVYLFLVFFFSRGGRLGKKKVLSPFFFFSFFPLLPQLAKHEERGGGLGGERSEEKSNCTSLSKTLRTIAPLLRFVLFVHRYIYI